MNFQNLKSVLGETVYHTYVHTNGQMHLLLGVGGDLCKIEATLVKIFPRCVASLQINFDSSTIIS